MVQSANVESQGKQSIFAHTVVYTKGQSEQGYLLPYTIPVFRCPPVRICTPQSEHLRRFYRQTRFVLSH